MDDPTTKDEIMGRIAESAAAFDALVERIPPERMNDPGADGDWTPRDVIAHIAADHRWFVAQLDAARGDAPPSALDCFGKRQPEPPGPGIDLSTQDGRNAWQYERNKELSAAEAQERLATYRTLLIHRLAQIDDADLDTPYTIADAGLTGWVRPAREGEWSSPLRDWIRGNTWHHYEDHAQGLRAFAGD